MVHHFHSKALCPRCLGHRVHPEKAGIQQLLRKILMNPKMVCEDCTHSWLKNNSYRECTVAATPVYR